MNAFFDKQVYVAPIPMYKHYMWIRERRIQLFDAVNIGFKDFSSHIVGQMYKGALGSLSAAEEKHVFYVRIVCFSGYLAQIRNILWCRHEINSVQTAQDIVAVWDKRFAVAFNGDNM